MVGDKPTSKRFPPMAAAADLEKAGVATVEVVAVPVALPIIQAK